MYDDNARTAPPPAPSQSIDDRLRILHDAAANLEAEIDRNVISDNRAGFAPGPPHSQGMPR